MKKILTAALMLCLATPLFAQKISPEVDHIALCVKNYDKSISFYKDVFGFESVPVAKSEDKQVTSFKLGPQLQLLIISGAKDLVQMNRSHLTLVVDSMELFTQKLDKYQVMWYSNNHRGVVTTLADGVKQIYLKDPDGYEFEIVTSPNRDKYASLKKTAERREVLVATTNDN